MQFRTHRFPTQFPLKIKTPKGPQMGQIIDVSNEGAQVGGLWGMQRGDKIVLDILSHGVEAVVRWSRQDKTGISFRPQITDCQVATLCHRRGERELSCRGSVGYSYAEMR